uniref:ShTK domain protein n=1 Tax=Haemonchus placei TaxID=6290 RepID=A0A0N4WJP6_HAEPC
LLFLGTVITTVNSQGICSLAPTQALQIICSQINAWANSARSVAAVSPTAAQAPSAAGGGATASLLATSTTARNAYECMDIACLCGFFGGSGGSNCVLPNGQRLTRGLRKEYRVMTDAERQRYHTAMWTIKGNGDYDTLSRIHSSFQTSPGAHSGPAFLPWHREFIKRLEIALRRVDPSIALPYWDSTLESTIPNPAESCLFTNELMGRAGPDGSIRTGAFRGWLTVDQSRVFRRNLGATGRPFQEADIAAVQATGDFRQVLANTAPSQGCPNPAAWTALEYSHGNPHVFIGGDMFQPTTSTNDPIFWNHHSFVDLIWENWRQSRQGRSARETQYPPNNAACSSAAHYGRNTMQPFFPMTNIDGLSNQYTDNLYTYQPRPTCSGGNPQGCGSRFLFCDFSHGAPRCSAKIAVGGNCGGYFNNEDRCYRSICQNNRCVQNTQPPTTQPPIITTTPAGPTPETCFNEQQCCAPWANNGQCRANPSYMSQWCRASCGLCTPRTYDLRVECSNRHVMCATWAARGECTNNPSWMVENCRQACNRCGQTRQQICYGGSTNLRRPDMRLMSNISDPPSATTQPPSTGGGTCVNQHYCCIAWASRGYCSSSAAYMAQYCPPSCNQCRGSSPNPLWNSQSEHL